MRAARPAAASLLAVLLTATPLWAQEPGDSRNYPEVTLNLYGTFGAGRLVHSGASSAEIPTGNLAVQLGSDESARYGEDFNADSLTRIALQSRIGLGEKTAFTLQGVAHGYRDYEPELEWAYFGVDLLANSRLRIGRIRRPLFRYSEFLNVGYAYPWTRPPAAAYLDFDGYYSPIDGIDFIYRGSRPTFDYSIQVYIGYGTEQESRLGPVDVRFKTYENGGFVLDVERNRLSGSIGLHLADYSIEIDELQLATDALEQLGYDEFTDELETRHDQAGMFSLSGGYQFDADWSLHGEIIALRSGDNVLVSNEAAYVALERQMGSLTLAYTYGQQFGVPGNNPSAAILAEAERLAAAGGVQGQLVSATLTSVGEAIDAYVTSSDKHRDTHGLSVRYDFLPGAALKFEYERLSDRRSSAYDTYTALAIEFVY